MLMPKPDFDCLSDSLPRPITSSSLESDYNRASVPMIQSQNLKLSNEY